MNSAIDTLSFCETSLCLLMLSSETLWQDSEGTRHEVMPLIARPTHDVSFNAEAFRIPPTSKWTLPA